MADQGAHGVALYLLGHVAFRVRLVGEVGYEKLAVAATLLLLYTLGTGLPAWGTTAIVLLLTAGLCAAETTLERRRLKRRPHVARRDRTTAEPGREHRCRANARLHGPTRTGVSSPCGEHLAMSETAGAA